MKYVKAIAASILIGISAATLIGLSFLQTYTVVSIIGGLLA